MGYWINGEWVWNHSWRRPLFDWEMVVLIELNCLLDNVALKQDIANRWTWKASPDGAYSVKTAYKTIQIQHQEGYNSLLKVIWMANAPLKSKAFGWRILINKIPTKMNMIRRGIELSTDQRLCALCKEQDESTNHLFFACKITYAVWQKIYNWCGFSSVLQNDGATHLSHHLIFIKEKKLKSIWPMIWLMGRRQHLHKSKDNDDNAQANATLDRTTPSSSLLTS
ncbi:hypothetical protein RIF29_37846 [Crotalaria pallida]|uniref:Reverse transcriptase zinc-binding domain-containing protein n=1 Tax=Crotalaria pallida TaxID=3830 RepID=A0AAN9HP29_CROPI